MVVNPLNMNSCGQNSNSSFSSQNAESHLFPFPPGFGQFALGVFDDRFDFGAGLGTEDNRDAENRRDRENASQQRQPRGHHGSRRPAGRHEGVPTLEGYIFSLGAHFSHLLLHLCHGFIFCLLVLFSNW